MVQNTFWVSFKPEEEFKFDDLEDVFRKDNGKKDQMKTSLSQKYL